jgi:hypothetical protein
MRTPQPVAKALADVHFKVTQEFINAIPNLMFDRGLPAEVLQAVRLEVKGGPCPLCGTQFKKREVRNPWGHFDFYEPACHCFKKCTRVRYTLKGGRKITTVGCGKWLTEEKLLDINQCTSCAAEIV